MKLAWRLHANPLVDSSSPLLLDLSEGNLTLSTARFSTIAQGGFADGSLGFTDPPDALIRDAVDHFLMHRVVATDAQGNVAYEGFVSGVRASMGHHVYYRTMDTFANVAVAVFDWAGNQAGFGKCPGGQTCKGRQYRYETDVDASSNTMSYLATKEHWFEMNGVTKPIVAVEAADVRLNELLKKRGVDINTDKPQPNSLELTLWGYYSTLQWKQTTWWTGQYTEIATIIQKALTVVKNAEFISTDYSNMQTTGRTITFNLNKEAFTHADTIQNAIKCGDSSAYALFFQVWEDRKPWLFARTTAPRYFSRGDSDTILDASRNPVPDYLIRAGGHIVAENNDGGIDYYSDVLQRPYHGLVERTEYDDLRERVNIPAPSDVQMTDERLLARVYARLRR